MTSYFSAGSTDIGAVSLSSVSSSAGVLSCSVLALAANGFARLGLTGSSSIAGCDAMSPLSSVVAVAFSGAVVSGRLGADLDLLAS